MSLPRENVQHYPRPPALEPVADRLSVSVAAVGHWENPKGPKPSISRLARLADVLQVDVRWLLVGSSRQSCTGGEST